MTPPYKGSGKKEVRTRLRSDLAAFRFGWNRYFALALLKAADTLPNQVDDLSVYRASFVFCNVPQFIMKCRFNLNSKMLVVFVSHRGTSINLI